jgi:hypothetical protein
MKTYRLVIHQGDRLFGHFESDTPCSAEAVKAIAACLSQCEGYRLELRVAYDEKRLVESTSQGVRLLSRELLFKPSSLDEL